MQVATYLQSLLPRTPEFRKAPEVKEPFDEHRRPAERVVGIYNSTAVGPEMRATQDENFGAGKLEDPDQIIQCCGRCARDPEIRGLCIVYLETSLTPDTDMQRSTREKRAELMRKKKQLLNTAPDKDKENESPAPSDNDANSELSVNESETRPTLNSLGNPKQRKRTTNTKDQRIADLPKACWSAY
ncbi:hypothetical protein TWF730_002656 [Orbilia blumenaviensis]|uniref:Uncharacterized protein n=1 Tax=Orbilia blumenaviensis TaxID=1796055 RepID=A0AAV9UAM5_9PEZI